MMQNIFLLAVVFSVLSLLYQGIFGLRKRKYGSRKREFAIQKVPYTEKIYKTFFRVNRGKWTFGVCQF